ncbi:hypothetical protein FA13DRAFT_1731618 [Coprinellus micaceus]|uniref:S-adenosyl-L-methionine-dependent methyltransferase n=1 Tax=Coprinellus micaceus TaxID=71717 RepID=A0A4Y7TE57_COPMI|nr:hypothetical protein FA13DRAFT_1731618 [Coprinellus micaceus]
MESLAPTSILPPLGRLLSTPGQKVHQALQGLRSVYFPLQRSAVFIPTAKGPLAALKASHVKGDETPRVIDSGYASAEEDEDEHDDTTTTIDGRISQAQKSLRPTAAADDDEDDPLELLRGDAFERSFAIKWLTGFMSRAEPWIASVDEGSAEGTLRSELLEDAIRILSAFNGDDDEAELVELTRSFSFVTSGEGSTSPVLIELNDAPVSAEDHTSVGLQSWGSCILFAERLCVDTQKYLADPRPVEERGRPLRILELGAGTGMLSIVAAKVLSAMDPPPKIVATDYHPDVLANLKRNIETNFPTTAKNPSCPIEVYTLDWESPATQAPFDKPFDIILAADVVYHPMHAEWIRDCVSKLLLKPTETSSGGVFWMFMAIRSWGRHEGLDKMVDGIFRCPEAKGEEKGLEEGEGQGEGEGKQREERERRLVFTSQENVEKQGGIGRADEAGYKFSKIMWL